MDVGIIVLAAGASVRLGRPKQLLHFKGKTLLQHAVDNACASISSTTVVVLGARAELLQKNMENNAALVVVNAAWEQGMATSIQCGLHALMEVSPAAEGVIITVCDQPFVTTGLLNQLISVHQDGGKKIVTCSYSDTFGPPSFFHKSFFEALLQLRGDTGARNIIRQHTSDVAVIPFPEGTTDVDTAADYELLQKDHSNS